jgi:hypothetical protein
MLTGSKMQDILDSITHLSEVELGYLVDPESPSPIDWNKYPVMFIDGVSEEGDDSRISGKLENTLSVSVAIMVSDSDRRNRIKKVTAEITRMKQFIYTNYNWGCNAITSEYISSSTVYTTDTDSMGAALVNFEVVYRENIN